MDSTGDATWMGKGASATAGARGSAIVDSGRGVYPFWRGIEQLGVSPGSFGLLASTQAWGSMNFFPFVSLYYAIFTSFHLHFSFLYLKTTKRFHLLLSLILCIVICFIYLKYKTQKDFRLHFWASIECRFLHNSFHHSIFNLFSVAPFELKFLQHLQLFIPHTHKNWRSFLGCGSIFSVGLNSCFEFLTDFSLLSILQLWAV